MKHIFNILLTTCAFVSLGCSSKILVVFPMPAHSHFTLGLVIAKELANRGHEVTFINPYPQKTPIKNLREISLAEIVSAIDDQKQELYEMGQMSYIGQLEWVTSFGRLLTEKSLKVKEVQNLLKSNETFDILILEHFMNEAMVIFQHKFKCPLVLLAPGPTTVFNNHLFANPSQPAYVPSLLADFGSNMTFWERLRNAYYDLAGEIYVHNIMLPLQGDVLKKCVPGAPNLKDILYNSSLMLLASHISLKDTAPLQPNIKEIGGYHVTPPKALPKDLQEYLDSAKEGVIIFSMGSNLKSADFPQKKKQAVLRVFSKLKQKVLWKFEADLPEKSDNVKIMKWLPQGDVLAHPNVIAFITHVGLLGTIEAVYHGVPMLGLPVFWDQEKNIEDAVRQGIALKVPFQKLTEENFEWALTELVNNPIYRENAKKRKNIMHDQPMKQLDEAIFWIEYVIRHKGAPHLRSPALDLKWYQRHFVDTILFLCLIGMTVILLLFYAFKLLFREPKRMYEPKKNE